MESEPVMNEQESLRVIHAMIDSAKKTIQDDGTLFLMWGWLVLFASVTHYLLLTMTNFAYPFLPWATMPIAGIVNAVYSSRVGKKQRVKTYIGEFMTYLWAAFTISLIIVLVFMPKLGMEKAYPILILLYGIGTFVSGGALRFKPLIYGGALNWPIAIVAFFVPFEYQLLLLGLSVTCSYIIPGHLLRLNYMK